MGANIIIKATMMIWEQLEDSQLKNRTPLPYPGQNVVMIVCNVNPQTQTQEETTTKHKKRQPLHSMALGPESVP
eukprot:CCRYP_002099-RA/>CCRYP_002099-RA protein AED:0.95 eAED:0.95 QI:0/0/0/0.25/1/1/4/0/73